MRRWRYLITPPFFFSPEGKTLPSFLSLQKQGMSKESYLPGGRLLPLLRQRKTLLAILDQSDSRCHRHATLRLVFEGKPYNLIVHCTANLGVRKERETSSSSLSDLSLKERPYRNSDLAKAKWEQGSCLNNGSGGSLAPHKGDLALTSLTSRKVTNHRFMTFRLVLQRETLPSGQTPLQSKKPIKRKTPLDYAICENTSFELMI